MGLTPEKVLELLKRADSGNAAALSRLREAFDADPAVAEVAGDMAWHAEEAILRAAYGNRAGSREAGRRVVAKLREDLAGANPTPMERLLAARLARFLTEADYLAAIVFESGGLGLKQRDSLERRYERANGRAMAAASALAAARHSLPAAPLAVSVALPVLAEEPAPLPTTPAVHQLPPAARPPTVDAARRPPSLGTEAAARRRRKP
jgi:hypothetical protein